MLVCDVFFSFFLKKEADDNDYQTEDSGSDATDSDIDIDENDEVKSDGEDDGEAKRKRRLVTKAYKVTLTRSPPIGRSSGQAKRSATKIRPKAVESDIFDKCQPEVAGGIISGVAVDQASVDIYVKCGDSMLNSGQII